MTDTLSISDFMPLVGAAFTIRFPDGTLELTLGASEIFLVPLGPRDGRMRYEAVFN